MWFPLFSSNGFKIFTVLKFSFSHYHYSVTLERTIYSRIIGRFDVWIPSTVFPTTFEDSDKNGTERDILVQA